MVSGARQGGLPHPHLDEPCAAARRYALRVAERWLHRGRRELHARLAGAAEPRDADEPRLRDREGRGREERDAAQEQRRRAAAAGRGLHGRRRRRDGPDRDGDVRRRRRQRARDAVRADHELADCAAAAAGGGTVDYVQGYDLDGELVPSSAVAVPAGTSVLPGGLPAGDAGFAGQPGWLRQQVSTTVPASGAQPAACAGTCAADRVDPTVDYTTGSSTLGASTGVALDDARSPRPSAGSWQLKVFVKNQCERAAVRRRARDRAAADQHRRLRRRGRRHRRLLDRRLGRAGAVGEVARGARAAAGRLHADVRVRRDAQPRPARLRQRRRPAVGALRVGAAGLADPVDRRRPSRPRRPRRRSCCSPSTTAPRAATAAATTRTPASQLPGWQDAADQRRLGGEPEHGRRAHHRRRRLHAVALQREVGARDVVPGRRRRCRNRRRAHRRREPGRQAPDHVPGRLARRGRGSRPTIPAATRRRS